MDDSDDGFGPPLPPGFKSRRDTEDSENVYGPSVPSKSQIGPRIPGKSNFEDKDDEEESDEETYGPMPPKNGPASHSSNDEGLDDDDEDDDDDMYGAALPPHLLNKKPGSDGSSTTSIRKQVTVGPSLPPGYKPPPVSKFTAQESEESDQSDDDQGIVGPMPSNKAFNEEEYRIRELELRAKRMRDKLEGKGENKVMERESWMLDLPEEKSFLASLGGVTGPRQFRTKVPAEKGDRSVWTDSPAEREARKQGKKEDAVEMTPQLIASKKRDAELAEAVESYNEKKRAKPLVDLHKLQMAKATSGDKKERKPFTREDDMCVNKFDDAQKASMLKKAAQLNDRFHGGDRKFL